MRKHDRAAYSFDLDDGAASDMSAQSSSSQSLTAAATAYSPINNMQPSLVIPTMMTLTGGIYPARDDVGAIGATGDYLGQIHYMAAPSVYPGGTAWLNGQLIPISQNTALFSLLGTTYGGDGKSNFALPELSGQLSAGQNTASANPNYYLGAKFGNAAYTLLNSEMPASVGGGSQAYDNTQATMATNYVITVSGAYLGSATTTAASEIMGAVWQFGGNFAPPGTMFCEGQLLNIADYETLFTLIGTTYGGDGQTTFALPDLRGRTIVHAGNGLTVGDVIGTETNTIATTNLPGGMGQANTPLTNMQPSLVLTYMIALQGVFPSSTGTGSFPDDAAMLTEIVAYAGYQLPNGWYAANGQLLPINQNQALFSLLGTTYGGNGSTNFALPDLRGRAIIGTGGGYTAGQVYGSTTTVLDLANIPPLYFSGTESPESLYGGDSDDVINGLGGNDTMIGNGGNDTLTGGAGDDTINGSLGSDTASYSTAPSGVTVDLDVAIAQNTGGAGVDTLVSIENLTGSAFGDTLRGSDAGNNVLQGNAGNDFLYGRGGDDTLYGGAGDDLLDGGAGTDTADYSDAAAGVTVNLGTVIAQNTVGSGTDTLTGIENLVGSTLADFLTGTSLANTISGGGGNDTLNGAGGADTLAGGAGNDIYIVGNTGVTVSEFIGGGTDEIRTTLSSYTLPTNVEILRFNGFGSFTATGATGNETFYNDSTDIGGNFTVYAGGGGDTIYANGQLDSNFLYGEAGDDRIVYGSQQILGNYINDGGAGTDTLVIGGGYYNSGSALGLDHFRNFEVLELQAGADYNLGLLDGHTAAGQNMVIDGKLLGAGDDLTFNGSAETDGTFLIYAGAGTSTLTGGAGDDGFYFGAAYTSADVVNGGGGTLDQIALQGNYSGGVTLGSLTNVEMVVLLRGNDTRFGATGTNLFSYNIIAPDSSLAAGGNLILQANTLRVGENFTFNGSAELDGTFTIYGGYGVDNFTGGSGSAGDGFFFGQGRFGTTDIINGGGSAMDQLGFQGNFTGVNAVTFGAAQLTNVEFIVLLSAVDTRFGASGGTAAYNLTMNDGNVASGERMIISANSLKVGETLTFNGAAETNGSFRIFSGAANDIIRGGQYGDEIYGGGGGDVLRGNGGADQFVYIDIAHSSASARDWIEDFTPGSDKLNLTSIDANQSNSTGNEAFDFIGSQAFSGVAGQLRAQDSTAGYWVVQGDVNGDGVADFAIDVVVATAQPITAADILL